MAKEKPYEIKGDQLIANETITVTRDDKRQIRIAKAGQTVSLKKAKELGFVPEVEETESKSAKKGKPEKAEDTEKENKSTAPAENKAKK